MRVYTVKQLASLAHISVRTLHYYDEIGLLKPSYVKPNGYRCYEEKELIKLQQILFFRELDFSLEHIKQMFDSPIFNTIEALEDQQKMLELKKERLDKLLHTIHNTIITMKKAKKIKAKELYHSFTDQEMEKLKDEARQKWGNTEAYKQSVERTKHWTKEDYNRIAKDGTKFTQKIADSMSLGIEHPEIQKLIAEHHKGINVFYDCDYQMYRCLGKMYIEDPRFTAYYEKFATGLADFMCSAIAYYCDQHEKKL